MVRGANVRCGVSVRNARCRVLASPVELVAVAVILYARDTPSAQRVRQTVRLALNVPSTGSPPVRTATSVSVPPLARTVMPRSGRTSVRPCLGRIEIRTGRGGGAAVEWDADESRSAAVDAEPGPQPLTATAAARKPSTADRMCEP